MKKIAVILSGCGVFDGAEIHESVLVMLALDRANAEIVCTAPDVPQHHVVNHFTKEPTTEQRNVLVESARIARGNIIPLNHLKVDEIDGVILPGGYGAAKNLCDFALAGSKCTINPQVSAVLREAHKAGKPLGFVCIAPAIAATLFGSEKVELTIGNEAETAQALESAGATHIGCNVRNVIVDKRLKIVSTPAYMLAQRITESETGISKLVQAVLEMA